MTERSPNSTLARRAVARALTPAVALLVLACGSAGAQSLSYTKGQNVSPAYEGWEEGPDGELYFLFGYMNRNWEETPNVPIGPNNSFSPGPADRGQPTNFLPRRNRFVFKVPVPADFGEQELVWSLKVAGEEIKAYVIRTPGATITEEELIAWSKEQLANYKYPRIVEFRDELPMTATGKILKRELR